MNDVAATLSGHRFSKKNGLYQAALALTHPRHCELFAKQSIFLTTGTKDGWRPLRSQ